MGEFADSVFEVVCRIPRGQVATYGQVARMVGRPRSARFVGFALHANPRPGIEPESIPCHRVVFKDGSLASGFAFGGPGVQLNLLLEEGVRFIELPRPADEPPEDGERVEADLHDGRGLHPVWLADVRVDMQACRWSGRPESASAGPGEDGAYPTAPPPGFDWRAELGE